MAEPAATAPRRPRGRPPGQAGPVAPNDDLLPLALEAFADLGYEGASMRALCRRLGVSHNLLHQRFGSKERLWYAAVDHGFRSLAAELVTNSEDDDLERLRFVMVRWLELTAASPALTKIINQEAAIGGPRLDYMFDTYIAPVTKAMARFLRKLARQGRVRDVHPSTWYFLVVHGAGGPLHLRALAERFGYEPGDDDGVRRYACEVVDALLSGLVTEESVAGES
ncbi:MAG TPA: TetR/AcrR family transcriptional regulator [Acidimicrobiales bacterium]